MGFFSFHTNDTGEPIYNAHQSERPTRPVFMLMPSGEMFTELYYNGYGVFGGYDFYACVAVLNGHGDEWRDAHRSAKPDALERLREIGIDMAFNSEKYDGLTWPNLIHNPCGYTWRNEKPRDHSGQGFWEG